MPQLFELVIVAFLAVIAVELFLIHRDLVIRQPRGTSYSDDAPGQTINVNVGAPAGVAGATVVAALEPDARAAGPVAGAAESADQAPAIEVPEPAPSRPAANPAVRATSSGLLAKKCPACAIENSSMRSECFNCGGPL